MQAESQPITSVDDVRARRPEPRETRVTPGDLLIERALRWERERANDRFMVQPTGGGAVREYTWGEAVGEARRMAAHLKSLGFPHGSRVAMLAKNSSHFVMMDLAIWMAGYVSVPLFPTVTASTVKYVLEHSEAKAIFIGKLDKEWNEQRKVIPSDLPGISTELSPESDYETWESIVARTEPLGGNPVRKPSEMATIIYTSGSTGTPKGVVHDFEGIAASCKGAVSAFGLHPEDRVISYLPLAHVFERLVVESAGVYTGFQIFFAESLDTFVKDVQRARPTLFHSVPRLWLKFQAGVHSKMPPKKLQLFLKIPILNKIVAKKVLTGLGLDQARAAVTGSAPIPAELVKWYRDLGLELCEGYAMSENFAYSHFNRIGKAIPGTVGPVAPDVEHKLGPDGEILIKSPGNMVGYYKQPELTREAFTEDGFLRTGDRGVIEDNGFLRIVGRTKEIFKTSKGKYVAPAPIESGLQATGLIELASVTGDGLPQPVALCSLAEGVRERASSEEGRRALEPELAQALEAINAALPPYEKLDRLYVTADAWTIESGLLTPTMKIKRAALDERYGSQVKEEGPRIAWLK